MEQKQLLIIINDGGNDFVDKKSLEETNKNYFQKKTTALYLVVL